MAEDNPKVLLTNSTSGDSTAYVLFGFVQRVEVSVDEDEFEGGVILLDEFPGTTVKFVRPGDNTLVLKFLNAFNEYQIYPPGADAVRSGIFPLTNGNHVTVKIYHRYPK